ncbi:HIT family protein [uncultured Duncaniella sp.]|uniref:HIT family protein n=1 Tax=uncultured Duncaniella sp. TaxID=2768039 RepID=UPI00272B774F|nr:HIT domain-containing protein [uncultured Duncaniella sp.]
MKSDPKDCLYCTNNETLHNLMIEIAKLDVSRVFLFKEQTYHGRCLVAYDGRCLVAYDGHVNDLFELSDDQRNAFMKDVTRVTRAMYSVFHPEKINYGAYSDKLSHLHFHLAPKYVDGPDYGGTFRMNPGEVYLSDEEYADMVGKMREALTEI